MKLFYSMRFVPLSILFMFFSIPSCLLDDDMMQDPDIVQGSWHTQTLASTNVDQTFTLYVYLPHAYPRAGYLYPVFYSLDGDQKFDEVAEIVSWKIARGEMPDTMVVGIGYGDGANMRDRDYTPTNVADQPGSGGAENFYQFIRTELIPFIDNKYQTVATRGGRFMRGHSFGGIATLYGLFFHNDIIQNFIATSPSLWYDNLVFFDYEYNYSVNNADMDVRLFISMGSQEPIGMPVMFLAFVDQLKKRNYPNLKMKSWLIDGKRHENNQDIAFEEALKWLF